MGPCIRVVSVELVTSGSNLKVEPADFAARSNKGCERKEVTETSARLYG